MILKRRVIARAMRLHDECLMRDDSDADIETDADMRRRDDISAFLINSVDNRKSRTVLDSEVEVC